MQTVKAADPTEVNVLGRREWEEPIATQRPVLDARKTGRRLRNVIDEKNLQQVFATMVTRKVIEIEPCPCTRIEAAIDECEIRTADGGAVEPISEIELELKSGDPAALCDVALQLLRVAPIRIETQSKAERGYRLFASGKPQGVHVGPVALDPNMRVEDALDRFGQRCLAHVPRNEAGALAGEPEAIHQMRVAVRRLRSALSALKQLQNDLGHANDVRVAYQLLGDIPETSDCDLRAIDRAGGIVLGWHERDLADREPELRKSVRRFKRLEPFW